MVPPPPPELMEELVEEILLRFPPDDLASLVRAALVCKLWCRLVSVAAFRRRFREFHRNAAPVELTWWFRNKDEIRKRKWPLVGVINYPSLNVKPSPSPTPRLVILAGWFFIGAHHGRVLLYRLHPARHTTLEFSVWDPVTNEQRDLPELPYRMSWMWQDYSAAVVCAATASGKCDHLDCHRGPFLVVLMCIERHSACVSVYSSEAGAWSHLPDFHLALPRKLGWFRRGPMVLAGCALYLLVPIHNEVVKSATGEVSAIPVPSEIRRLKGRIAVTDDDGDIGFVDFHKMLMYDKLNVSSAPATTTTPPADQTATASDANTRTAKERRTLRPRRSRKPNSSVFGPEWL